MTKAFGVFVLLVAGIVWGYSRYTPTTDNEVKIDLGATPTIEEVKPTHQIETLTPSQAREVVSSIGTIREIIRNAQTELRFFGEARRATQKWFASMAAIKVDDMPRIHDEITQRAPWVPPHSQVILVFYHDDYYHNKFITDTAKNLIKEGHKLYRVPTERQELYEQYQVHSTPMWLVVRGEEVVYRHTAPPTFPAYKQQTQTTSRTQPTVLRYSAPAQTYYAPSSRSYSAPSCVGGVCR